MSLIMQNVRTGWLLFQDRTCWSTGVHSKNKKYLQVPLRCSSLPQIGDSHRGGSRKFQWVMTRLSSMGRSIPECEITRIVLIYSMKRINFHVSGGWGNESPHPPLEPSHLWTLSALKHKMSFDFVDAIKYYLIFHLLAFIFSEGLNIHISNRTPIFIFPKGPQCSYFQQDSNCNFFKGIPIFLLWSCQVLRGLSRYWQESPICDKLGYQKQYLEVLFVQECSLPFVLH